MMTAHTVAVMTSLRTRWISALAAGVKNSPAIAPRRATRIAFANERTRCRICRTLSVTTTGRNALSNRARNSEYLSTRATNAPALSAKTKTSVRNTGEGEDVSIGAGAVWVPPTDGSNTISTAATAVEHRLAGMDDDGAARSPASVLSCTAARCFVRLVIVELTWGAHLVRLLSRAETFPRISARTILEQGCVFTVDLPRAAVPAVALAKTASMLAV